MSKLLQKLNFTTTFKGTLQLSQRTLKQKETTVSGIMGILSVSSAHWHFSGSIWRIILEHLLELLHKELCIILPNLALIQFTWGGLKQVTNSPLVHAPFVMLDALARFLVSSDMYSSSLRICASSQKKPSWEMQNLNLHNCKMNPFFSLITSLEPLCIFIFQCFLSIQINVEPKFLCNKDCLIMINTKVKQRHFCNSHWRNMRLIILAFSITILALDTKVISQLTYYFLRKFWTLRF